MRAKNLLKYSEKLLKHSRIILEGSWGQNIHSFCLSVFPAVTRLTVYRRLQVELASCLKAILVQLMLGRDGRPDADAIFDAKINLKSQVGGKRAQRDPTGKSWFRVCVCVACVRAYVRTRAILLYPG